MSKKRKEGNFLKSKGFLLVIVLVTFILFLTFFFGDSGILEIIKTRNKIEELKESIARLEKEKERLIKEIVELKKNPLALERKAREELWLMKKNEKVVVIVKDKKKKEKEAEKQKGK